MMTPSIMRMTLSAAILSLAIPIGGPALAQTPLRETPARVGDAPECPADNTLAEAATPTDPSEDGASAQNSGTTGWSGGTGGSVLGTNTQGAVETSPTWQPPTARGLDLAGEADEIATC